jgi:hypothetical protein
VTQFGPELDSAQVWVPGVVAVPGPTVTDGPWGPTEVEPLRVPSGPTMMEVPGAVVVPAPDGAT